MKFLGKILVSTKIINSQKIKSPARLVTLTVELLIQEWLKPQTLHRLATSTVLKYKKMENILRDYSVMAMSCLTRMRRQSFEENRFGGRLKKEENQ